MNGWLFGAPYEAGRVAHSIILLGGFMPGWGTGSFENEDAQSFLGRLNSLGVDDLRQMLTHAAGQDYLEAPESGAVVAAAEVVAALAASCKGLAAKKGTSSPPPPPPTLV